jgi:L-alanine-DL-glutamate epimerase-like enolase superfamily enzyme
MARPDASIDQVAVSTFRIPTDYPESDGTLEWKSTTLVIVEVSAGGKRGLGFTYADRATGRVIEDTLAPVVRHRDAMDVTASRAAMISAVRNLGRPGIASMAISALDIALWDLKSTLLGLPLIDLFGAVRPGIEAYGSGGFTSYDRRHLQQQLRGWVDRKISKVKIKIGRDPHSDLGRVEAAREAIGDTTELFVDANGAYSRKQALAFAENFASCRVSWFEEPVSSDDLDGLHLLRNRAPAGMSIAAGEYGYDLPYFDRMLSRNCVDVLQADTSRCGGFSGFLGVAALCEARSIPLSAHCCPSLHAHVCCAVRPAIHLEYFHDHSRIEQMLFDGAMVPKEGIVTPDRTRPGIGLEFKRADARKYEI